MKIIIDQKNSIPIYEQIYNQIRDCIVDGTLKKHDKLPSIRLLAKELEVSVITSKRAYEDLEKDSFIYSVPGKGSYVSDLDNQVMIKSYVKEIEEHLEAVANLAEVAEISEDEILLMYRKIKGV
ncbi:MAG TPA: GntR family transcriptional regulator, partial [Erysipelothrix sp.]